MIRTLGAFGRHKIPIEEKAHALHLCMAGLSSWEIADAMEDHYGRKPSHASVLNWARALGSVGWTIPPRERRPVAADEAVEKVNGREVYVWAAIDVDTRELLAIKATWSSGPGAPWTRSSS
jgi:transposase-like protein